MGRREEGNAEEKGEGEEERLDYRGGVMTPIAGSKLLSREGDAEKAGTRGQENIYTGGAIGEERGEKRRQR